MKIPSSFTHPRLFQTCMSYFVLLNTKEDILKNVVSWAPLTSIIFFYYTMQGDQQLFGSQSDDRIESALITGIQLGYLLPLWQIC